MTSAIDPSVPASGVAFTADLRANLLRAKNEIEALQAQIGVLQGQIGGLQGQIGGLQPLILGLTADAARALTLTTVPTGTASATTVVANHNSYQQDILFNTDAGVSASANKTVSTDAGICRVSMKSTAGGGIGSFECSGSGGGLFGSSHATGPFIGVAYGASRWSVTDTKYDLVNGMSYYINNQQVVTNRKTGWTAATGTATRTAFATGSVTTAQLAERVKALLDDLIGHGLIGA